MRSIGYITWATIGITYLRFKKAVELKGIDRTSWQ